MRRILLRRACGGVIWRRPKIQALGCRRSALSGYCSARVYHCLRHRPEHISCEVFMQFQLEGIKALRRPGDTVAIVISRRYTTASDSICCDLPCNINLQLVNNHISSQNHGRYQSGYRSWRHLLRCDCSYPRTRSLDFQITFRGSSKLSRRTNRSNPKST